MRESRERFAIALMMAVLAVTFHSTSWVLAISLVTAVYALASGWVYRVKRKREQAAHSH